MWNAFTQRVKSPFAGAFLRTFCHATEDCDRVSKALLNVAGPADIRVSKTTGVHGNPITILEATVKDGRGIGAMIGRLKEEDIRTLLDTLQKRIDEGCNVFFRLDKQRAFAGEAILTSGEDVILVRMKVKAFPAKCELAERGTRDYLESELKRRDGMT